VTDLSDDATSHDFSSLSDIDVTLMLADSAQAIDGKLFVLGGGWAFIGPAPSPAALAGMVHVPWNRTNTKLAIRFELVDEDGAPVEVTDDRGAATQVAINLTIEVGRAPGAPEGMVQNTPFAINLSPLPFTPGRTYEWRCSVDGVPRTSRQFHVRAA
jgi:hypothetical protein